MQFNHGFGNGSGNDYFYTSLLLTSGQKLKIFFWQKFSTCRQKYNRHVIIKTSNTKLIYKTICLNNFLYPRNLQEQFM